MDLSSISPGNVLLPPAPPPPQAAEAVQRKQLARAANSVNQSGILGNNQAVFLLDPETRHPIIRIENRETHELVLQIPPEYLLRLAESSPEDSVLLSQSQTDT